MPNRRKLTDYRYHGIRLSAHELRVLTSHDGGRNWAPLAFRLDLANGRFRSHSAQAAISILADYLSDDAKAVALHEHFDRCLLARLEREWVIEGQHIDATLADLPAPPQPVR
jgi:hypothetical protein